MTRPDLYLLWTGGEELLVLTPVRKIAEDQWVPKTRLERWAWNEEYQEYMLDEVIGAGPWEDGLKDHSREKA